MTLFELAYSHLLYQQITRYDDSLNTLLLSIKNGIDLSEENHVNQLLIWLNKWGCRHISKESYKSLTTRIQKWWKTEEGIFCKKTINQQQVITIFDSLSSIIVSNKNGIKVHFGPTATAKALFIINKNRFIPWDIKIRENYNDSGEGYYTFLSDVKRMLNEVFNECKMKGFKWNEIVNDYFPGYISDLKLIDEYFWVTRTNNLIIDKTIIKKYLKL